MRELVKAGEGEAKHPDLVETALEDAIHQIEAADDVRIIDLVGSMRRCAAANHVQVAGGGVVEPVCLDRELGHVATGDDAVPDQAAAAGEDVGDVAGDEVLDAIPAHHLGQAHPGGRVHDRVEDDQEDGWLEDLEGFFAGFHGLIIVSSV